MKVVIATGGFDPIHSGHIAYFEAAAVLGDILLVGLNSDAWLRRKKGRAFMPYAERSAIIKNLRMVHQVLELQDDDGSGADGIRQARALYPDAEIVFANGGDRNASTFPKWKFLPMMLNCILNSVWAVTGNKTAVAGSWMSGRLLAQKNPGENTDCYTTMAQKPNSKNSQLIQAKA